MKSEDFCIWLNVLLEDESSLDCESKLALIKVRAKSVCLTEIKSKPPMPVPPPVRIIRHNGPL